jgi:pimeloyl-ACP methyl ester carboxylesterase
MIMKQRFFQLGEQWCVMHLPKRPNGFALFILGDVSHFVDSETSLWIQHAGKKKMLHELGEYGYTIFYSHLYGANWGSEKAVKLAKQLIHYVLKSEILNNRIYILAEGMGALVALQLMDEMPEKIRAIAMLNPCLDLQAQLQYEKENKFFYKRLLQQLKQAYELEELSARLPSFQNIKVTVPIKFWQISGVNQYPPFLHARKYAQFMAIPISYHLPERKYQFAKSIDDFYKRYSKL